MTKIAKSLGLFALMCSFATVAKVYHVSINTRMFELGAYPEIRLNIVADEPDARNLKFVLRQSTGDEKLIVLQLNRFLVVLVGMKKVTDPMAKLLVQEHRGDRLYEIKNLPLFDDMDMTSVLANKPASTKAKEANTEEPTSTNTPVTQPTIPTKPTVSSVLKPASPENNVLKPTSSEDCTLDIQNETLWSTANRYAVQWKVSGYSAMLAIHDANPRAFANNRINALMKGSILYCPSKEVLARYPDPLEAKKIFTTRQARK